LLKITKATSFSLFSYFATLELSTLSKKTRRKMEHGEQYSRQNSPLQEFVLAKNNPSNTDTETEEGSSNISILFTYIDIMLSIILYFDKFNFQINLNFLQINLCLDLENPDDKNVYVKWIKNNLKWWANKIVRTVLILLIVWVNYLLIINDLFLRAFLYVILIAETRKIYFDTDKMQNCLKLISLQIKRWICFISLLLFEELFYYFFILSYFSLLNKLWICMETLYVLFICGPNTAVHILSMTIFSVLNKFKLLM
jgi:hypothetical protein